MMSVISTVVVLGVLLNSRLVYGSWSLPSSRLLPLAEVIYNDKWVFLEITKNVADDWKTYITQYPTALKIVDQPGISLGLKYDVFAYVAPKVETPATSSDSSSDDDENEDVKFLIWWVRNIPASSLEKGILSKDAKFSGDNEIAEYCFPEGFNPKTDKIIFKFCKQEVIKFKREQSYQVAKAYFKTETGRSNFQEKVDDLLRDSCYTIPIICRNP